jgi:hypothetical protein
MVEKTARSGLGFGRLFSQKVHENAHFLEIYGHFLPRFSQIIHVIARQMHVQRADPG